ncbi:glutamyl-tRNA amidotransferase subunit A (plasmid) [Ensifer adhaerens OV14]|nr:glutamyl-tRNA amidotransferase subunit A [Ensifer adhaerens OV14]
MFRMLALVALLGVSLGGTARSEEIDVVELTARQVQEDLKQGKYTSRELTQAFLERIAKYNPVYNAIITFNPHALVEADAADSDRLAGKKLGPLAGVPVVVKDTMDMAGLPTTAGWAPLSGRAGGIDLIPTRDATVVQRLRDAGAIILGKTNVPVLSLSGTNANDSWAGPTYNAANPNFAPGGSSAGTATAVSASFAVLGLGAETGGSIQNPAAAQGLVSVKPTFGLVPNAGVFPSASSTRDVDGPLAKTVYDAAVALDVIAAYTPDDPKTTAAIGNVPYKGYAAQLVDNALIGKRIGLYGPGWRNAPLSEETQELYRNAIAVLEKAGAVVVQDPFSGSGFSSLAKPADVPDFGGYDLRGEESAAFDLQNYLGRRGPEASIRNLAELREAVKQDPFSESGPASYIRIQPEFIQSLANPSTPPNLAGFLAAREGYIQSFNRVMIENKLDALMFPQMRTETPKLFSTEVIAETTVSEINIGGFPAVTVPAGYYKSDTPFGVIFVGKLWSESDLLNIAYGYEQHSKLRRSPELGQSVPKKP